MSEEETKVTVIYIEQGPKVKRTHIGDGVYASFDGSQIWLDTKRERGVESIALDGGTFEQLLRYAVELGFWRP